MPKAQVKDSPVVSQIVTSVREIRGKIVDGRKPSIEFPHDLSYVMDTYLPAKLKHPEKFLP